MAENKRDYYEVLGVDKSAGADEIKRAYRKLAMKYPETFFACDKSDRTYQEKVYLYLDSGIYRLERFMQQHPELRIIGIEQKFEFNYDNVHSFNGSIDRAFQNITTGEILIQDIKSWPVPAQNSDSRRASYPAQSYTLYQGTGLPQESLSRNSSGYRYPWRRNPEPS